ncbi:MAG: hypothetical protein LUI02_03185 [Clostridiales bacterium]|nr:hypothetical protein [Clostridiales bacterium]
MKEKAYRDEKIDYTGYLAERPEETDRTRAGQMAAEAIRRLADLPELDRKELFTLTPYEDGIVGIWRSDGRFFRCYDTNKHRWFSGAPGDCKD